MEKIWNDFELKKPPFITLPGKYNHFVQELHAAIDKYFSEQLQYEQEFSDTAALLSRLMARRKNSFNKMKGFKDVCKLNSALCRLLRVDFRRHLDCFRNTLPDVEYDEGTVIELPTRDSFAFLLIRLIAISELYRRIIDCCTSAAEYFTCQIRLYFFFEIHTLLLAVLGKIYSMSTKLLNAAADLYNSSLPFHHKLPKNPKSKFLKETQFSFPDKLEMIKTNAKKEIETVSEKNQPIKVLLEQEQKLPIVKAQKFKKLDTGTQVERSSKPMKTTFNIEDLNSAEKIKLFITMEDKSRSTNLKSSITSKILSHEWSGATKLFRRKVQNGDTKKAVNIFRKFLSLKMV